MPYFNQRNMFSSANHVRLIFSLRIICDLSHSLKIHMFVLLACAFFPDDVNCWCCHWVCNLFVLSCLILGHVVSFIALQTIVMTSKFAIFQILPDRDHWSDLLLLLTGSLRTWVSRVNRAKGIRPAEAWNSPDTEPRALVAHMLGQEHEVGTLSEMLNRPPPPLLGRAA